MLLISYLMKCSDFVCFYFSLQVVVLKMYNVKKSVQMDFKNKYLKYIYNSCTNVSVNSQNN